MKWIIIMAFVLQCEITVGAYRFRQVNEVRIEKSWRELGDKCTIKLPSLQRRLQEVIRPGDAVIVRLSYSGLQEHVEFEGYVRRVMPTIPFEIECENDVYYLRRTNIKKSWKNTTLKEIVQHLVSEVNSKHSTRITLYDDIPAVNFKQFRIENANAAHVLQTLKDEYGLTSYFRGKELFVGLAYQQNPGQVKYSLAWNIIDNNLEERVADDTVMQVKVIGIKPDNTRVEVEVGDEGGEQRTLFMYDVSDKKQLETFGREQLQKLKYDGWEGSIRTFLYPYAEPLMTAELHDPQYGERRAGTFVIDSVTTEFSTGGARREVELGAKISV